jgi:RNA polymerase sigma-70 factor, ECF subfamily
VSTLARGFLRLARSDAPEADVGDARLVAALSAPQVEGLAAAFDRWHQRVRVLARRLLGDEAAAEDVVQEVFEALPRATRRFRGDVPLEAFVLSIAVKRSRQHQRAAARRRKAFARLGPSMDAVSSTSAGPELDAYRAQLARRLARALDRLPHDQRVAFVLCEVEGMTAAEASAIAEAPEATMRTRLFHARRKLRADLAAEHEE